MNSKERVLAAVRHRQGDRIPITFDAADEVYESLYRHFGTRRKEDLFDRLRVDTWMILPRNFIYPEAEAALAEKTSIWGYRARRTAYSGGVYDEICHCPLAGRDELSDIRGHRWPAADALDFSHFTAEARAHADRAVIGVFTWGPYFVASFVRGMQDLLMDMATGSAYADLLLGTVTERCEFFLQKMLSEHGDGIDIVYMADDTCTQTGPIFSREAFGRYVAPYLRRFAGIVHGYGKKFLLHTCGSVRAFLPAIIDCGVDMLEPVQVRAAGMEPAALKGDFGRDICFYGGVDLQRVLCSYAPGAVAAEVRALIDVLGKDGGYVLGPGHTYIQPDAPLPNILSMYRAAFESGRPA